MKTVERILLAAAIFAAGFGAGYLRWQSTVKRVTQEQHAEAQASYGYYRNLGMSNFGDPVPPEIKRLWARELGPELETSLRSPHSLGSSDEYWGTAYLVMRDDGNWAYRPEMSQTAQDEMVRYLCFRLRKGAYCPPFCARLYDDECKAILTFPSTTLQRNGGILMRTLSTTFDSPFNPHLKQKTESLLTYLLEAPWAADFCWDHFKHVSSPGLNEPWYEFLRSIIGRSQGSDWPFHRTPSVETQSSAKGIIEQIRAFEKDLARGPEQGPDRFQQEFAKRILFVIERDYDKAFEPKSKPTSRSATGP